MKNQKSLELVSECPRNYYKELSKEQHLVCSKSTTYNILELNVLKIVPRLDNNIKFVSFLSKIQIQIQQ